MQSHTHNFAQGLDFNFGTNNLFVVQNETQGTPFPPAPGYFLLLNGTIFGLLNGQNLSLL
jgi:hypothetical protein